MSWAGLGWLVWYGGVGVCLVRSTYLRRRRNPQSAIGSRAAESLGKKSEEWDCQLVFASGKTFSGQGQDTRSMIEKWTSGRRGLLTIAIEKRFTSEASY